MAKEKKAITLNASTEAFNPEVFSLPSDKEIAGREIKMAKAALKKYAEDASPNGRKLFRHAVMTLHEHGIQIPVRRVLPKDHEWAETEPAAKMDVLRIEDSLDPKSYEMLAEQFYQQYIAPGDIPGAAAVLEKSVAGHTIELDKFEQAMAVILSEKHPEIDTGKFFGLLAWIKFNLGQAKALLNAVKEDGSLMTSLKETVVFSLMGNKSAAFDAAEPMRRSYDPDIVLASLTLCQ